MAVTSIEVPFRADVGRWSRWHPRLPRWALPVAMALVLIAVLAGAGYRLNYVYSFQPLGPGSGLIGPVPYGGSIKTATDGIADTENVLVGPPGTTGTVAYPIGNNSDQDVRILGPARDDLITSLHWYALHDLATPLSFPMTLRAHDSLTLLVTVTKPSYCGEGTIETILGIPLRYEALGVEHTYVLPLQPGDGLADDDVPIALCLPSHLNIHTR